MGGSTKTSTHDVTISDPLSPSSKSKMGTASAATPTLSGSHLTVSMLVIVMPCCSTSLAKGTSQTNEQATRYSVTAIVGLVLVEVVVIYVHIMNHLMVTESAIQMQINLVIVFQLMIVVSTCSLTRRVESSQ
jgi:F0F1-type ATP synthase membrane subunit c/vacuolar-type H+-ATPase subunit K